jgi:hypothetical protein
MPSANNAMPHENPQQPAVPHLGSKAIDTNANVNGAKPTAPAGASQGQSQGQKQDHNADQNEGEGSRSAARNYDKATEAFVKSGRVESAAKDAEAAVDGPEGDELRAAEEKGRAGGGNPKI